MPPPTKRKRDDDGPSYPKKLKTSSALPSSAISSSSRATSKQLKQRVKQLFSRNGPYSLLVNALRHTHPIHPRPELKIYDTDMYGNPPVTPPFTSSFGNSGFVSCNNKVPTGTGVGNFIGNQITIKSVSYRYELDVATIVPTPTSGRIILVWDRQPNGLVASYTDIFQSNSYLSYGNVNTRERFVILRNDQFSLSPNGDQSLFFERYVKVNMTTTFANGSAGTVPLTGALLFAVISDQSFVNQSPFLTGTCRVRYYDN